MAELNETLLRGALACLIAKETGWHGEEEYLRTHVVFFRDHSGAMMRCGSFGKYVDVPIQPHDLWNLCIDDFCARYFTSVVPELIPDDRAFAIESIAYA